MNDLRELHRRVMDVSTAVVGQIRFDQLGVRTPCSEWNLGELLAHMIGQNYGFAAAADGETESLAVWADRPVDSDVEKEYAASAERVVSAFAVDDLYERQFWLPQVRGGVTLPAETAVGFHFVDYVVHSWDVARAIGVPVEFDDEVLTAVLPIAEAVPDGANRTVPGASFQPGLAVETSDTFDRVLTLLGRSPDWS
ncbi:TIGR03086 family metal-binding protein [Kribbella sp. NPDC023855]|uniref:TIGR03086 family metal-binding protein n=1 Tax=Kribbella sp. NPDC023855 TaxID=3154698 RepID=UPI0033CFE7C5